MFTTDQLEAHFDMKQLTKRETVERLYPSHVATVDYAIPLDWIREVVRLRLPGIDRCTIRDSFVWGYDKIGPSGAFGQPLPVNRTGIDILKQLDALGL